MLIAPQRRTVHREHGFTLMELLVVILIIGILAAIAIPLFLNQRREAVDGSVKSDVVNAAKAVETWTLKQGVAKTPLPANVAAAAGTPLAEIKSSDGTILRITGDSHRYYIHGTNTGGNVASSQGYYYDSGDGGLIINGSPVGIPSGGLTLVGPGASPYNGATMISTWNPALSTMTCPGGKLVALPLYKSTTQATIHWGDGATTEVTQDRPSHCYTEAGEREIVVEGTFGRWGGNNWTQWSREAILSVDSWEPETGTTNLAGAFWGSENLTEVATPPSTVTDMSSMFYNAYIFNGKIGHWNVSKVQDMSSMFGSSGSSKGINFNQDISQWDVSKVQDMYSMFANGKFTGDLSKWNVSNVTDMGGMFKYSEFNGDIGAWNVSKVSSMNRMFMTSRFNQDISQWKLISLRDASWMFLHGKFNQDISDWDMSKVANMDQMFRHSQFNQDIGNWDVSGATSMNQMFEHAYYFNHDLSKWNVQRFSSAPQGFATGSELAKTPSYLPRWGQAPAA